VPQGRPYLFFLLPCLVFLVGLAAFPTAFLFYMSFTDYLLTRGPYPQGFAGLANYLWLFTSPSEGGSYWVYSFTLTAEYVVGTVAAEYLLGLGFALLLRSQIRGKNVLRVLVTIPIVAAPVVAGLSWRYMYDSSIGIINWTLRSLNLPTRAWLGDPALALPSVMIASVWEWTPFVFLVMLAGLESMPKDLYEAADIDGCSAWQKFRYLTSPLLFQLSVITLLFRIMEEFKTFDIIAVTTLGGPGLSTTTISWYIYSIAFSRFDMGKAAAAGLLLLAILTIAITPLTRRAFKR